jgi:Flp pilus assembly pilin Flp
MLSIINITLGYYFAVLKCDRKAAGALQYALLVSFIAIAVVGAVTNFGTALSAFVQGLADTVTALHAGGAA